MAHLTESHLEEATLEYFRGLGYGILFGSEIAPGEPAEERVSFSEVVLPERLRATIKRLNPALPDSALEEAFRKVTRQESPALVVNNRRLHKMLVNGVTVEFSKDGRIVGDIARLIDFENSENNDWAVVNQFAVSGERDGRVRHASPQRGEEPQQMGNEDLTNRRPDVVVFVNGLPLAVIELKNPADETVDIWKAYQQLQTYKNEIPALFVYNEAMIISDGIEARMGSLTAEREWFMPWRTVEGESEAASSILKLEVLLKGVFEKQRFLEYLRHCIVFEDDGKTILKKMAGYHQFHAVRKAVEETIKAMNSDRRIGVVWHTQGSGKSLTMVFYAGKIILHPAMDNPTIVVITDRNDLDDQLFGTFSRCSELLRQKPVQAESHEDLVRKLQVASGGVIFTTIQKFLERDNDRVMDDEKRATRASPQRESQRMSGRRNIVVIADEAHRSQYDFIKGYARAMRDALPNASFIGFTGTPIELRDKNTRAVFGDYISIYDIQQAVDDRATVPIYYEARLAKLELDEREKPHIDAEFEEVTEGEEVERKEKLKSKWAALEAIVGSEKRVNLIARDLVNHFEARDENLKGKAMIVCMSRRICIDLYNAIIKLRPEWHSQDDRKGVLKIVMTGSASDALEWQPHIRNKVRREALAKRFKDPKDPFKLVILRDMWLTGFDVPCLHTMYLDKPMRGHSLMQTIARVNRVFGEKPGGLVVDYLGLADFLRQALADYTINGGKGDAVVDQELAVSVMMEKYEICRGILHGFDWTIWKQGTSTARLSLLPTAQEHILAQEEGKERYLQAVKELTEAFALSVPHEKALVIRDDVGFFQAVRAALIKSAVVDRPTGEELDHAIQQLISRYVASDQVIDIFSAAGLKKPDISILSDEFLAEVKDLPQKHLAIELLRKLLADEIRTQSRRNLVQGRSFAEMLERTIKAYQNRAIELAQVIEALIDLAKEINQAKDRPNKLNLTEDEIAFYDALEVNDSAVKVLGDETLKEIARELVKRVRENVSIDWTVRESVRAKLRVTVKHILRRYGYPPDKQAKATETVLQQAELIAKDWGE
jgi:type I restriction enzyme R subunit